MKKGRAVLAMILLSAMLLCSCGGSGDVSPPTLTLISTATSPTKTSPIPITATFSKAVTGFVMGDITLGNGTAGNFVAVSTTVYTFDVTPSDQGAVTVDVADGVAQDAASNRNTAATQFSITYDSVTPTLTLTSTAASPTKTSPIPMTATFSEAVTGFVVGDITVGNGTAGNFMAVSTTVYTFDVTPSGQGAVTEDVADGVAQDAAANGNTAATQFSITYDSVAPPEPPVDPPPPPAIPVPPPDGQFDNVVVNPRATGDVDQIEFGTPGKDKIEQYGGTGTTTQYAEGSADADWLLQVGGDLRTDQTAIAGSGDDKIYQYGGKGDNAQYIEVGAGNQTLIQVGGDGNNTMQIHGGTGSATIEQYGGKGDNTMTLEGDTGDDTIKMYGGAAKDTMDYTVTGGTDKVTINGGNGDDTLTMYKNQKNFTLVDNNGNVIFKSGDGGSEIAVSNVEHIKVIGDDGTTIFQQG